MLSAIKADFVACFVWTEMRKTVLFGKFSMRTFCNRELITLSRVRRSKLSSDKSSGGTDQPNLRLIWGFRTTLAVGGVRLRLNSGS